MRAGTRFKSAGSIAWRRRFGRTISLTGPAHRQVRRRKQPHARAHRRTRQGSPNPVGAWYLCPMYRGSVLMACMASALGACALEGLPALIGCASRQTQTACFPPLPGPAPTGADLYEALLVDVGRTDGEANFPPGTLYVYKAAVAAGDHAKMTWLVVKLDTPTPTGERSYSALINVNCAESTLSVQRSVWSLSPNGAGPTGRTEEHSPPIRVVPRSGHLISALALICDRPGQAAGMDGVRTARQ